jgi:hypothetical protein
MRLSSPFFPVAQQSAHRLEAAETFLPIVSKKPCKRFALPRAAKHLKIDWQPSTLATMSDSTDRWMDSPVREQALRRIDVEDLDKKSKE